ncbi:MAG: MMPL family transporter [bacterium]|nr:MMPL family transporter [bacterium]
MNRFYERLQFWTDAYIEGVLRHRYVVMAATLVVVLACAFGASRITFNSEYRGYFGPDNPYLIAFDELEATYTKTDNVLFVVAAEDGEVFDRNTIDAIQWLTEQSWLIPHSTRVDSITNFQHTRAEGDTLIVEDLYSDTPEFSEAPRVFAEVENIARAEPLLMRRLVSEGHAVTGLNVTMRLPGLSDSEEAEVVAEVRRLEAELPKKFPGHRLYSTGNVMLGDAFVTSSIRDLTTLVPLMYLMILIAAALFLRSLVGTLGVLMVIVLSILPAMGLAGWIGIELTPTSSAAPTVIMTLAVADSVHVLVIALMRMRDGMDKFTAMRESLRLNLQPVFLTSFTTVIGFLSLNFGDVPPFGDLGNITAIGVAAAFVTSVGFLPAFFVSLPVRVRVRTVNQQTSMMDRFSDFVIAKRRPLLFGGVGLFVFLAAFIPRLENNEQWVDYFAESMQFRQASDFTQEKLTGLYQVEYSLPAAESGGIAEPGYLNKLDAYAEWLRAQPEVYHVFSFSDTMRRLNKNMFQDDPEYYRVPDSRELAAQYLLLYEMSLPYGLDLNDRINVDKSATRMSVTLNDLPTRDILAFEKRAAAWQAENFPVHMRGIPSGPTAMFSHMAGQNVPALVGGAMLALVIITITMIVALRSWKFGLLTVIPNLVPALITFGIWALAVVRVDIAAATVIATTLGIVVDDSVHFMSKYMRALRGDAKGPASQASEKSPAIQAGSAASPENAVRYALRTVGPALILTSAILVIGFSMLALSTFRMNWTLGVLSAMTITIALLWDLLVLPAILILAGGEKTGVASNS